MSKKIGSEKHNIEVDKGCFNEALRAHLWIKSQSSAR